MKITTGDAHNLFIGLTALDGDDIKLAGDVRLKVAIDMNLLKPHAMAYEMAQQRALADINRDNRQRAESDRLSVAEIEADFRAMVESMRAIEIDLDLKTLLKPDLRLDDNPKINSSTLARLLPIVEGLT